MPDKSYLQAIQDLQNRLSSHSLETIAHMLTHHTTVSQATFNIQDERMRAVVKNTLMTGQMVALLTLMKEMGILDETHYEEFRAYLMHSLTYQSTKS
jgi:chemotaxis protein CheY-P-specific phosphatase CheC